ncbi:unnamed protein product [Dicrocoelium dendriticum]|nr:unnamed protein product [Dicrocoelium dendriticum]
MHCEKSSLHFSPSCGPEWDRLLLDCARLRIGAPHSRQPSQSLKCSFDLASQTFCRIFSYQLDTYLTN